MRPLALLAAATGCLALLSVPSVAQKKPVAKAPAAPVVAPEIRTALGRMATALKALDSYQLKADVTSEEVLDTGQKVQSSSVFTADARRPNRLYISSESLRKNRKFYYDGSTVTVFGPKNGYYATVDAPPTTYEMIKAVADRYGVDTPLADLFQWGAGAVQIDSVKSAMYAGPDTINGMVCDNFAFRQDGVDWQIWIRRADPALPCKLVIVNTDDPAQPQTTSVLTWSPGMKFDDDHFRFTPSADAKRITIGKQASIAKVSQ